MRDEKEDLKPNINALIQWWIPLDLLKLRCKWIEEFVTYSCGNESHYFKELFIEEKKYHYYYYK
jgi:hypothetical protein